MRCVLDAPLACPSGERVEPGRILAARFCRLRRLDPLLARHSAALGSAPLRRRSGLVDAARAAGPTMELERSSTHQVRRGVGPARWQR